MVTGGGGGACRKNMGIRSFLLGLVLTNIFVLYRLLVRHSGQTVDLLMGLGQNDPKPQSQQPPDESSPLVISRSDALRLPTSNLSWQDGQLERQDPVVIGYAISVSACLANSTNVFDGAAVLAHSIRRSSIRRNGKSSSLYDYRLYAFVHPSVDDVCVARLEQIGYNVLTKDTPFRVDDIQNDFLRKAILENGCCGEKEFLKLYAYTLVEHPIVVHMDLDTFLLQPIDELFDAMLRSDSPPELPAMWNATLPETIDFFFTRDYLAKSTLHRDPSKYAVQGGFLVLRPNVTLFRELIDTVLHGTNYTKRQGWGRMGYAGYWGAAQIQGFLSYFYGERYPQSAVELNRCIYNTMAKDDPYLADGKTCRTGESTCEDCRIATLSTIKTAHLTTCWKPWQCPQLPKRQNPHLCHALHREWFGLRQSFELELGLDIPEVGSGYNYNRYFGYCQKKDIKVFGKKALYVPIMFPNETESAQVLM